MYYPIDNRSYLKIRKAREQRIQELIGQLNHMNGILVTVDSGCCTDRITVTLFDETLLSCAYYKPSIDSMNAMIIKLESILRPRLKSIYDRTYTRTATRFY